MEKPIMMLINPASGRAITDAALGSTIKTFCKAGWSPTVYFTTGPGSAKEITARLGPSYPHMVCLGGDGTLSDSIAGLMSLPPEQRPALSYIPMGTANDVATTLGLPIRQPAKAARQILAGSPMPYDVGEISGVGFFTYIAAFGAFTEVSYKTDQELKHTLGHAAYVLGGLNSLASVKSIRVHVEHDEGEMDADVIYGAASNSLSVAGMVKMNPRLVNLSDGKFELLLVHKPTHPGDLNSIVTSILDQSYSSPCITVLHTAHVKFCFDHPVAWTRDGENGGEHETLELFCHHRPIEIWR